MALLAEMSPVEGQPHRPNTRKRWIIVSVLTIASIAAIIVLILGYCVVTSDYPPRCGWLCGVTVKQDSRSPNGQREIRVAMCDHGGAGYGWAWLFEKTSLVGYRKVWVSPTKAIGEESGLNVKWIDDHHVEITYESPRDGRQTHQIALP